eukprot:gnl/TRDRNA2_/TRDRNA2_101735_c0_seq1.p1 gnl/TRDRNA2_/TRDRNA2_101735_c0~~gnl/TRDRNA2_/TRDRNA2_101735_c0_seq1.p1  ORF type:complete len:354 (-),score=55.66 gnl/TRDRNA2_/TRDRNA2_101735_c0_seq1:103-1164(-)
MTAEVGAETRSDEVTARSEDTSPRPPAASAASGRQTPLERLDLEEDSRLRQYKLGEKLGQGAYGEVHKAMVGGRFMAVKRIRLDLHSSNPKAVEKEIGSLLLEINTLKRLKHPRIVRYHGCFRSDRDDDPALLIFLEFMPSGSIAAVLKKFGAYGMGLVRKYTRQILEGLEFLHSEKIIHRDVKGANILIDGHGDAKLADFGACRELEALHSTITGGMKSIHGSVFWMAPEVMKYRAGRRSDIWSMGCTCIEMITAEPPWPALRVEKLSLTEALRRIVDGPELPSLPEKIPSDCRQFLECVLVRDHTRRPYASDLLKHRFIRADAPPPESSPPPSRGPKEGNPSASPPPQGSQ